MKNTNHLVHLNILAVKKLMKKELNNTSKPDTSQRNRFYILNHLVFGHFVVTNLGIWVLFDKNKNNEFGFQIQNQFNGSIK